MTNDFINQPLNDLVSKVFESLGFVTLHPMQVLKHPLADSRLSFVLKRVNSKSEYIGVIVRDWKRVVGVGQIHKAEELIQACPELSQVLIVSSMGFSFSASRLAEKVGLGLISRGELVSLLQRGIEAL
ncbi:MAG: restriction endonuclease [Candidatus Heimdallarchaeota archaeon]|nr:MAG: restriction endonuclease [Candidatus Heimdallarchaeota archaeon]